jgi:sugar/nucleoside kinase (ribokinase family)
LPPPLPLEIDYLAIGHPTIDEGTPQGDVIGGTVVYASVQAARLGWRSGFVGRADPAELAPLLAPFTAEVAAWLVAADCTTRFVNVADGDARTQWVTALAGPIDAAAALAGVVAGTVSRHGVARADEGPGSAEADAALGGAGAGGERALARVRVLHVAPVAREVDLGAAVSAVDAGIVGVTPQGLIRRWGDDGRVGHVPLPLADGRNEVGSAVDVVVVAEEERPFVEALTRAVRRHGGLVVVTRGSQGCLVEAAGSGQAVPALPAGGAVDRTGAGDVFAAALLVALAEGRQVTDAIRFAMAAAACSIEGLGLAAVAGRDAVERRLAGAGHLG